MTDDRDKDISKLLYIRDTNRIYQLSDGSYEERTGGSASWRHNSPGNLKFEYAHSADHTVHSNRTREGALADARAGYSGVVDLDQRGNVIFDSVENGRAAQIVSIQNLGSGKTVLQMLGSYSSADYSGPTHHDCQADMIFRTGDAAGVNLREKIITLMDKKEIAALADGIAKFEGWREGITSPVSAQQVADLQVLAELYASEQAARTSTLKQGMRGDDVKHAQEELHDLGYLQVDPNGRFGPATKAATQDFQRDQGLIPDGKIGIATQRHLNAEVRDKQIGDFASNLKGPDSPAELRGFDHPAHPQNALYCTLKDALPTGTSAERLAQSTAACYMSGISRPNDLSGIYINDTSVLFTSHSLVGLPAKIDISQPAPQVPQTMQQVQQHDQQQAQVAGQIQAQNAQLKQQSSPAARLGVPPY